MYGVHYTHSYYQLTLSSLTVVVIINISVKLRQSQDTLHKVKRLVSLLPEELVFFVVRRKRRSRMWIMGVEDWRYGDVETGVCRKSTRPHLLQYLQNCSFEFPAFEKWNSFTISNLCLEQTRNANLLYWRLRESCWACTCFIMQA